MRLRSESVSLIVYALLLDATSLLPQSLPMDELARMSQAGASEQRINDNLT